VAGVISAGEGRAAAVMNTDEEYVIARNTAISRAQRMSALAYSVIGLTSEKAPTARSVRPGLRRCGELDFPVPAAR
jgi:hypothetical protein